MFLTAISVKNLQFLSSRRLFSSKNRSFPLIRALGSTVFLVFRSSEASETLFFSLKTAKMIFLDYSPIHEATSLHSFELLD